MKHYYIYKFDYKVKQERISATVIFCDNTFINQNDIRVDIKKFYERNYQTDKVFILGGEYLKTEMETVFLKNKEETFKGIPRKENTSLYENTYIITFNKKGDLDLINKKGKIPTNFLKTFINEGLQNIFIKRGGLVQTEGSHHYVFPSGKHCDKFLRTGNILLFSCEIYFIAFSLLKHFNEEIHNEIYCDTSSINSIALALSELKNRFFDKANQIAYPIQSFSSYKGLYDNKLNFKKNAFLIVSASTSGNIINYITDKHFELDRANIIVLYYLDNNGQFNNIKENVLCNLTQTKHNPNGVQTYDIYSNEKCDLCEKGSYAVEVSGDVFLLEKPNINAITINVADADDKLNDFVNQFRSVGLNNTVLKTNYKKDPSRKYEIYIDYSELLNGIKANRYTDYKKKLDAHINQFVPSNTRYIIHLNDDSSIELAKYIENKISGNYLKSKKPSIKNQDNFNEIPTEANGAVLVVGSCISNGKNLLYLSRALRQYENLRVVYFVGISRTNNAKYHTTLKSNLKYGSYGAETSTYIDVENIYCVNKSKQTSWIVELDFIKSMIDFIQENKIDNEVIDFFNKRKTTINQSYSKNNKGLTDDLFFQNVSGIHFENLSIRNNFSFFSFDNYVGNITQSDLYFTISNIINSLRNSDKKQCLKQSAFVRNLLSPENFNRYNDGLIQACILRSANAEELSYSIDYNLSLEMKNILETLISHYKQQQGEALLEFLYAIAIQKLTLKDEHLKEVLDLLEEKCDNVIINSFRLFSKQTLLKKIINKNENLQPEH